MSCRLRKFVCIDYFSHACGKIPERGEHKGGSQFYGVAIVVGKARQQGHEVSGCLASELRKQKGGLLFRLLSYHLIHHCGSPSDVTHT